jgi:hypothetical protein
MHEPVKYGLEILNWCDRGICASEPSSGTQFISTLASVTVSPSYFMTVGTLAGLGDIQYAM